MIRFNVLALVVAAAVVGCLAGEFVARLDDWQFADVPLLAHPSKDDLKVRRNGVLRGAPGARFGKWQLNSLGFRGPELLPRAESCQRIAVLGSSESFGAYESSDHEYVAVLRRLVRPGCREVVNTSVPGITLPTMRVYWREVVSDLSPDVVVIYPHPFFYLEPPDEAASASRQLRATDVRRRQGQQVSATFRSRLVGRLRNAIDTPDTLEYWLNRHEIAQALRRRGATVETEPPEEGLRRYRSSLAGLISAIRKDGTTEIVLLVPARRTAEAHTHDDLRHYTALRTFSPGVSEEAIAAFGERATHVVREVGRQEGIAVVDLDAALTGCRECFGDLVHFTDSGSAEVARLIAEELNKPTHLAGLRAVQ